jgi:hypothetical protein
MSEKIIDRLWEEHIENKTGICMICNECGGSYAWKCSCRRKEFEKNITRREINYTRERMEEKNRKQLLEERDRFQKRLEEINLKLK